MNKLFFRHLCLFLQGVVTLALCGLFLYGMSAGLAKGHSLLSLTLRFIPGIVHLVLSFILALITAHYLRTTFGSDAQVMPYLLLLLSLMDLRAYPVCYVYIQKLPVPITSIARLYQIVIIAAMLLSMECMVYQTEINTKRISTGMLVATAVSILIGMVVPLSPNTQTFLEGAYIGALTMRIAIVILGVIGCVMLLCSLLQENVSKETAIKCVAYTLNIFALTIYAFPYGLVRDMFALILEMGSLLILVLVAHGRRIWA